MFLCVHQAEPVLSDIQEVCKAVDQQTPEEPAQEPTQVRENFVLVVGIQRAFIVSPVCAFQFVLIKTLFILFSDQFLTAAKPQFNLSS